MKPKSAKAERKKLPKGRVMYARFTKHCTMFSEQNLGAANDWHPVKVTPFRTKKSAKARLKIEQMTEEELVEGVAKAIYVNERRHEPHKMTWKTTWEGVREAYRVDARSVAAFLERSGT